LKRRSYPQKKVFDGAEKEEREVISAQSSTIKMLIFI